MQAIPLRRAWECNGVHELVGTGRIGCARVNRVMMDWGSLGEVSTQMHGMHTIHHPIHLPLCIDSDHRSR